MKHAMLFLLLFLSVRAFAQPVDTITIVIEDSGMDIMTVSEALFNRTYRSSGYYPGEMTENDNRFLFGDERLFVRIYRAGYLYIEAEKLPASHAIGLAKVYLRDGRLERTQLWTESCCVQVGADQKCLDDDGCVTQEIRYRKHGYTQIDREARYSEEDGIYEVVTTTKMSGKLGARRQKTRAYQ